MTMANPMRSPKLSINVSRKGCPDSYLLLIVQRQTVLDHDDLVAPLQSNKCPSPLFPPPHMSLEMYHGVLPTSHACTMPPPFHFSPQPVRSYRPERHRCGRPKVSDGICRQIWELASSAKTSKRGSSGVQERCRFLFASFQCFTEKQDKEEKAARKQGGGCLLVEQVKGPAFKEAVYRETSASKSSVQNYPT